MIGQLPQGLHCKAWKKKTSRKAKKRRPSRAWLWRLSVTRGFAWLIPGIARDFYILATAIALPMWRVAAVGADWPRGLRFPGLRLVLGWTLGFDAIGT